MGRSLKCQRSPTCTRGMAAMSMLEVADVRAVIGPHSVPGTLRPPPYGSTARCRCFVSRVGERSPALSK